MIVTSFLEKKIKKIKRTDRRFLIFKELPADKAKDEGGFTDSTVAKQHQLELKHLFLRLSHRVKGKERKNKIK